MSNEDRIAEIEQDVAGLQVSVSATLRKIDEQTGTLNKIVDGSQTNWQTLAAWATVMLGVMIYHGQLVNEPLEIRLKNAETHQQMIEEQRLDKRIALIEQSKGL